MAGGMTFGSLILAIGGSTLSYLWFSIYLNDGAVEGLLGGILWGFIAFMGFIIALVGNYQWRKRR